MTGELKNDKILVRDGKKGNRLYNKGYFGKPLSNNGLELDLYEGLYLLETDRLEIEDGSGDPLEKEDIIGKIPEDDFHREYLPYKDMRRRGYVLKKASDPASFRIFPRGGGPSKTPTKYWLCSYRENDIFKINKIIEDKNKISNLNKTMMTALVDEEGDITYYLFSTIDLKGEVGQKIKNPLEGVLFGDKTIVKEDFQSLHDEQFYGFKDNETLRLSTYETLYLTEKSSLKVRRIETDEEVEADELKAMYKKRIEKFEVEYKVYKDMRERSLIPKTGFKYGAPFRVYDDKPDNTHAEYIVQPVDENYECEWYQVSRAVRVAHSVRKSFLYAKIKDEGVDYLRIKRETP